MKKFACSLVLSLVVASCGRAAVSIPPAENFLPDDTLGMFTVPDCTKSCELNHQSAQMNFWHDAAMKPFTDKFMAKLNSELVGPLERDLGISFSNYAGLAQGQLTFAVVQNGWQGKAETLPGWLFLLDTRTNSAKLKSNLTELKQKWTDANKPIKSETIHGVDFTVLMLSSNDVPATLKKFSKQPKKLPTSDDSAEAAPKKTAPLVEVYLGQYDSLFIAGNSPKAIEKILATLGGSQSPTLSEQPNFVANQSKLFRDAGAFAWINAKVIADIFTHRLDEDAAANAGKASLLPVRYEKILAATGLKAVRSIAFSVHPSPEGSTAQIFFAVPETERVGLMKILAGETKETALPAFVPADVVKVSRWRFGGQKAWDTLEKMINEISPVAIGTMLLWGAL